jgi:hypothetical protein
MVMRYGESYFDPDTGWHPRPSTVFRVHGGVEIKMFDPSETGQKNVDNLHRLENGEVVLCSSLN